MAGILKVDQVQSDSNLSFNIAGSNVAFMNATSLQMVGSNVSLAGTNVITNGKVVTSGMPVGAVLQVVSTTKTDTFSTLSTSFVDVTGLSVSITPISSSSKILIFATVPVGHNSSRVARVNLIRNSTTICQPATVNSFGATKNGYVVTSDTTVGADFHFLDSPATTSSTTYKIQCCTNAGDYAMYVGNRVSQDMNSPSTITVMEIAA